MNEKVWAWFYTEWPPRAHRMDGFVVIPSLPVAELDLKDLESLSSKVAHRDSWRLIGWCWAKNRTTNQSNTLNLGTLRHETQHGISVQKTLASKMSLQSQIRRVSALPGSVVFLDEGRHLREGLVGKRKFLQSGALALGRVSMPRGQIKSVKAS